MTPVRPRLKWFDRRRWVMVGLLVAWMAIVAAAAGDAPASSRWLGLPSSDAVLAPLIVGVIVVGIVSFFVLFLFGQQAHPTIRPRRLSLWPLVFVIVLILALASRGPGDDDAVADPFDAAPDASPDGAADRRAAPEGGEMLAIVAVVGAATVALLWTRRRLGTHRVEMTRDTGPDAATIEPMIRRAAEQLALGTDARSSVLRAYAALERELGGIGHPRRATETPTEYMGRVLEVAPMAARAVVDLAALYEIARFSDHAVTAGDRERAGAALANVRSVLSTGPDA